MKYFCSYQTEKGVGNCMFDWDKNITDYEDIQKIEKVLSEKYNNDWVCILNYKEV